MALTPTGAGAPVLRSCGTHSATHTHDLKQQPTANMQQGAQLMCGFGFMAYGFDCCHRSIDFSLMPSIGKPKTEIKVKCKALKTAELKRQNKQFVEQ
ncbi:uncharacterized protein LOC27209424 [Drosophila simulans]|nr:uncharacterized protein LOC27209424 [Drosophila simulans]KMY91666.1 uncharacterized protein Dsimw501_GD29582 [Drosophila simulans]